MSKLFFGDLEDMIDINDIKSSTGVKESDDNVDLNKPKTIDDKNLEIDDDDLIDLDLLNKKEDNTSSDKKGEDTTKDDKKTEQASDPDNTSSSPFIQFAKVFHEEGLLDFSEEEFNTLLEKLGNPASVIVELANKKVASIIEDYKNSSEEEYKRFLEAREAGVDLNEYSKSSIELSNLKKITEEALTDNEDIQKSILSQYLKHKGMDADDIKDTIESYEDTNKLEARAKKALSEMVKIKEKEVSDLKENQDKAFKAQEEEVEKSIKQFKDTVDSTEELIGIKLTKQIKDKIKSAVLQKHSNINGIDVNKVNAKRAENPLKYAMIEALLVEQGVFDGKNLDIFTKSAKTEAIKALEESVNKDKSRSTNKGNAQNNKPLTSWKDLKF